MRPSPIEIPREDAQIEAPVKTPADEGIEFFQSALKPGELPIIVRELRLADDGGPAEGDSYIRLPPAVVPYVLRVSINAGTPASKNGVFKTNFPLDGGKFGRDKFVERKLPTDFSKPIQLDLTISQAGAFCYWVEYDGRQPGSRIKGTEGYFNIDPILRGRGRTPLLHPKTSLPLGIDDEGFKVTQETVNLSLNALSILTVVSKWMGPISKWPKHFQEASERGYTMLHWTPLQERGESDSPYSIRDQLAYEPSMFEADQGKGKDKGLLALTAMLKIARDDYGLLSLTDVVLNHTSNDSPWLVDHPEAGYSPANTPHLAPALELDSAMVKFSASLRAKSLPTQIKTQADVDKIISAFSQDVRALKLWEYYVLDPASERTALKEALEQSRVLDWSGSALSGKSHVEIAFIVQAAGVINGYGKYAKRKGVYVDGSVSAGIAQAAFSHYLGNADKLAEEWSKVVDVLNVELYQDWEDDTRIAIDNVSSRLKYTRLDENGPKLGEITEKLPIVDSYFTRILPQAESDPLKYSLANNGWIWDADPLQNFALLPSKAYLRRQVIAWGDCVKLRYGDGPSSNPWLWAHIKNYVISLAKTYDGFRIDNCHSTPLHVGTYFLDAARVINPDLYVCAELFTGSEQMDLVFVSRLGINSLVREAGNAYDPKEFSRILYRNGLGKPIGSMDEACLSSGEDLPPPTGRGPTRRCLVTPIYGSLPHALLYDLTHDNQSYLDKRSAEDALSTGALVAFSSSAIASVKGFDDLYPKLLELVHENRFYELTGQGENSGIARAKRVLNGLHREMMLEGYEEGHVHQENDYIVIHRVKPDTQKGYILIAHTAFRKGSKARGSIEPIKLRRTMAKLILGYSVDISSYDDRSDSTTLKGLPSSLIPVSKAEIIEGSDADGPYSDIVVPAHFPPGSIMVFETQLSPHDPNLETFCARDSQKAFANLNLVELNVVMYRADGEERDATAGEFGVYEVKGLGKLVYCGLEGWLHPLRHIIRYNDLGHPLCSHLREGVWAMDYIIARLMTASKIFPGLSEPAKWFEERFDRIKSIAPPFLRPKYFAIVILEAYKTTRRIAIEQMSDFVSSGHDFTQNLALCAIQMHGQVISASINPDRPTPSLAAGLPHFAAEWARCWGRDVFISLRGLFLTTGNFIDAKRHILAFSSTLKHGLIPNLLDSVRKPRYNSRDSPWWMAQNIQDYVKSAPDGISLLSESVKRRFPKDETWVTWNDPRAYAYSSTIAEVLQEILQRHADGISFREYNAGPDLDMQMSDKGFQIDIKVDWKTGLIFGGSQYNCGTWMDKMGESTRAGTKGVPGTPRDGAPVEIIGLLASTLRWLNDLSESGEFPFKGVDAEIAGQRRLVTYCEWFSLIKKSFEYYFYIPSNPSEDVGYDVKSALVNRRGIYKDVYGSGSGREWSDYQLRPNFPIAMVVAPELFDPRHAMDALILADEILRSPLGMKTLDPRDMQYRPIYDNANDSTDAAIAKGLNYHNGPEWGWPLGYFLRAYLYFDTRVGAGNEDPTITLHHCHRALLPARKHIANDPWAGIPELTNADGTYCSDSCNTQAWSASCLLDFLEDAHNLYNPH